MERVPKAGQRLWRVIAVDVLANADSDRLHELLLEFLEALQTQVLFDNPELEVQGDDELLAHWTN